MARVSSDYKLAVTNPKLAHQCHPTLNGDLIPRSVASASSERRWWLYPKGHMRQYTVSNRIHFDTGCPYRSGQRVSEDVPTLAPDVAGEWHPRKNGDLTPRDVTRGSTRKVWWMCEKSHERRAAIVDRTVGGQDCPGCHRETQIDHRSRISQRKSARRKGLLSNQRM